MQKFMSALRSFLTRSDVDMTKGSIYGHLIRFAVPLLLGNLFQQLYNTVDTLVVGRFVGDAALAAVGNTGQVINTFIGFFGGLAAGTGILISHAYGSGNEKGAHDTVETAMTGTFFFGIFTTVAGILLTPVFLKLLALDDEVVPIGKTYLYIYFAGIIGMMVYNIGSGILRAIGDSVHPFLYLIVSAVFNVVADLLFVVVFRWGVVGAAVATILAQIISGVLVLIRMMRTEKWIRFRFREMGVKWRIMGQIFRYGLPAGFQVALTSFSNIFVQSYINAFGKACSAGYAVYQKIDQFVFLPAQNLGMSVLTFIGQNLGHGDADRARKSVRCALVLSLGFTAVLIIPVVIFAPQITYAFNDNPEVLSYSSYFMRVVTPFAIFLCFNNVYANALRGAGSSQIPMYIMLGTYVGFRQVFLFAVSRMTDAFFPIAIGYPIGWIACALVMTIVYQFQKKKFQQIVVRSE